MPAKSNKRSVSAVRPRIRVVHGANIAIGPGKAELLAQMQATGSITEAARTLGMSYMRAWKLIKTMEQCFRQPLIQTVRGGRQGGGAALTATGQRVLALYQQMEEESLRACQPAWQEMRRLLRG